MAEIEQNPNIKMSYIPSMVLIITGLILMAVYGLKPYKEWWNKKYVWVKIPATFEKGRVISTDGPKSLVAKDTGARFKIKFTLRYEPRKLFDAAYFDQTFPAWLRLPNQSFLWTKTRKTYETALEAQNAFAAMRLQNKFYVYMDPANPRKAYYFTWEKWLLIQIGFSILALGLLWVGFTFIINTRRAMIAEKQRQEEIWRQQHMRRHHNKGSNAQPPQ